MVGCLVIHDGYGWWLSIFGVRGLRNMAYPQSLIDSCYGGSFRNVDLAFKFKASESDDKEPNQVCWRLILQLHRRLAINIYQFAGVLHSFYGLVFAIDIETAGWMKHGCDHEIGAVKSTVGNYRRIQYPDQSQPACT
jgi:hypothetical protein